MNNFKKQGNSIIIQSVNENVIPLSLNKISKRVVLTALFFTRLKNFIISKQCSLLTQIPIPLIWAI